MSWRLVPRRVTWARQEAEQAEAQTQAVAIAVASVDKSMFQTRVGRGIAVLSV